MSEDPNIGVPPETEEQTTDETNSIGSDRQGWLAEQRRLEGFEISMDDENDSDEEEEGEDSVEDEIAEAEEMIAEEFVAMFRRLDLPFDDVIDSDILYRIVCGRKTCDEKLAFFCDKFEEHFASKNDLMTDLNHFSDVSDVTDVEGWKMFDVYYIADIFRLNETSTKAADPVNVVVFSTLIALNLYCQYPEDAIMQGRYIFVKDGGMDYFESVIKDDDLKSICLQNICNRYAVPEILDIPSLLHHCISLGLGWLSAGSDGKMIHNHIIKTLVFDEIPEYMIPFPNYEMAQLVISSLMGESTGFAITEHFTLCSEENWKTLHQFLSVDSDVRANLLDRYIEDRITMIALEIVADKILEDFDIIEKKKQNVRENIDECCQWLQDFDELVKLD